MKETDVLNILGVEIKPEEKWNEPVYFEEAYSWIYIWSGTVDGKYSVYVKLNEQNESLIYIVFYIYSIESENSGNAYGGRINILNGENLLLTKEDLEKLITDAILEHQKSYFNRHSVLNIFGKETKWLPRFLDNTKSFGDFVQKSGNYRVHIAETSKGFVLEVDYADDEILYMSLPKNIIPEEIEHIIAIAIQDYWKQNKEVYNWVKQITKQI